MTASPSQPPPSPSAAARRGPLLRAIALTLAIGAAGGYATHLIGMPAPWLSGSMIVVAVATLSGVATSIAPGLRDFVFLFLGISMGTGVTPATLETIAAWPASILALALCVVSITAGVTFFYIKAAAWERKTAFLAALPGALSYVLAVAIDTKADVRRVAISQTMRLFLLVALMPSLISWMRGAGMAGVARAGETIGLQDGLMLLGAGLAGGFVFKALKVPAGLLIGALFASAALHVTGLVSALLPMWMLIPGFVVLGSMIGTRFEGARWGDIAGIASVSAVAIAIGVAISAVFAFLVSVSLGIPLGQTLLAFAPGGIEAMTIMAFALDMDPAYVAAHQVSRFIAMAVFVPWAILLVIPRHERAARADDRKARRQARRAARSRAPR